MCAVCGNLRCEFGEQCQDTNCGTGTQCAVDCPSFVPPCPVSAGMACGGNGVCAVGRGVCQCFTGYTGAGCDTCSQSFTAAPAVAGPGSNGTGVEVALTVCVRQLGTIFSCVDGVRNGLEEGVDCGGPHCTVACVAR
jgi:hypothetical protein